MQIIGLCRFSYPALGGFQVEHDSIEDRITYLYATERLNERFRLFETIALPCLKHQTDPDFELIIVVGDTLPADALARLHALISDLPQARIIAQPPRPQREVMKEVLTQARHHPDAPVVHFRHDDDDAVAVDYIATLRETLALSAPLLAQYRTVAFDWTKGYIAELGPKGISATEVRRNFNVAGLAMHARGGCPLTIMNFAHHKLPNFMPALSLPNPEMFVRTHSAYNDSRQKAVKPVPVTLLTPEEEETFRTRFAIDADAVRAAFSAA